MKLLCIRKNMNSYFYSLLSTTPFEISTIMASSLKSSMRSSAKDDLKQQEIMQAVVIADNFNQKFTPLTNGMPMVLLPLVNGVLLDYVLKSLEDSGIQETFLFCCSHNQLIRSYISSSRWSKPDAPMSVNIISSSSFLSMGDIMRELDSKALIRSDFVLINGDVITTFPIGAALEEHRKLRQSDKNCAITLLYSKALPKHRIKCKEHMTLIAVEAVTQRIRYYQKINKLKSVQIPLKVFQENEEVTIHYDLLDSHISICSPCVPLLFSDNFDYQILEDCVKGLIIHEELQGNSMYIHIVESGYGASVSNLYMYDVVSQHIMSRWTYPIVPDLVEKHEDRFSYSRHNVYKGSDVIVGSCCKLDKNVVIGKGTKIDENAYISNSVIGQNCIIGKNAIIKGSYLWDNVTVGDNCVLSTCLLGEKVVLHNVVVIKPGCVLGSEVIIGDNIILPPYTRLQSQCTCDDDSFGEDEFEDENKQSKDESCDMTLVGEKGLGFLCNVPEESEDEEEKEEVEDIWGKPDEESEEEEELTHSSSSQNIGPGEEASEESDGREEDYDYEATCFYNEVLESLQRGIKENIQTENIILDINTLKHTYNVNMQEVNAFLIKAILKLPFVTHEQTFTPQTYLSTIKPNLQFFHPLVSNYIRSAESQLDCLLSVEGFMKCQEDLAPAIMKVVHFWYGQDVLNENVIIKWHHNLSPENEKIRNQADAFIKWLKEADEESSDE